MHVTGRCHCGKLRYEAEVDPARAGICHCTDCQVLSGSPYRTTVPTQPGTFRLQGTPRLYVKTADSGNRRRHAFCPDCGAPLYTAPDEDEPSVVGLRIGGIDQRAQLAPRRRIWCRSALPWSQDVRELPAVDKG